MTRVQIRAAQTAAVLLALAGMTLPAANLAFSTVAEGQPLPAMVLPGRDGGQESYLGDEQADARVFAFVKGEHPRSQEVLAEIADLMEEFADRPVHWVLVVSDRHGRGWADDVAAAVPAATVLTDPADGLYGTLGVALTPTVGLADSGGILHAYLPYQKVHFTAAMRAHLRYLLGEIDERQLAQALEPVKVRMHDSALDACRRALKLAEILIQDGKIDKAAIQIENTLGDCPDLTEAYEAAARVRRLQGDEAGAAAAQRRADELRAR